ncbi:hypothetical protein Acr_03g0009000 [Actinidia rufa]|uniref:Uncharacterized protein n=1 Tax=Actinidia rufa TaxID=165716 RepID=A0A7J0ED55_9ERIC|nr:hypothetical protein Acr_03g0009000 [Actinidia rufa]
MEQEILYAQIYSLQHHSIQIGDEWTVTTCSDRLLKPDGVELFKRRVYIGIIVSAMLAFTVVMLFDCRVSLCAVGSWSQGGVGSDHVAVTAFKSSSP